MQPPPPRATPGKEAIAIVGSGCRFPGGADTPSRLWDLLKEPRDLLRKIPNDRFNLKGFYHPDPLHHGASNVQESYLLSEDVRQFDAQFFGIKPVEANAIDPQQRLLLETVYEAIETAGLTVEGLQGSKTAVFVGLMCQDYEPSIFRDVDSIPTYHATGNARSIMSNRISYFFDWRGPSMTIDTACSSSLVAVHQAVQALRAGESRAAVAAGSNLILGPENYIAESKLKMLSPTGRSRMWDENADGYARGEGVAAVVLKTLSAALEDGDHIECLIRETGINQDGRTKGITMPSSTAQAALIRETYAKAGLDVDKRCDRPQYFEAHGTGTPAGDPIEAEAISTAFFGPPRQPDSTNWTDGPGGGESEVLYVGSIKTVVGHTEGTAGLASLLKASLALQNARVPPNLLFSRLNPNVEPFYNNLEVPVKVKPWPSVSSGQPLRASVNCFGFGGANAHAILESYGSSTVGRAGEPDQRGSVCAPFVFSAASERSLAALLASYSSFLTSTKPVNLRDLAWTLFCRRSLHPIKITFSASSVEDLRTKIDTALEEFAKGNGSSLGTRSIQVTDPIQQPRVLGVFTGQGAQWARMGRELILASEFARLTLEELEKGLAKLPALDRPSWSLKEELLADASSSRVNEAALSQPLCTAIQIVLVDLFYHTRIRFTAVVGHSSGEIGAAYAAGFVSAHDAMRISYYRGVHAKLACGAKGQKGAMLAVGTSFEDAQELCNLPRFQNRIVVAASNSSASVTLSGDYDAIVRAKLVFEDEKKFARSLVVEKAYHSHHMVPCSEPYLQSLQQSAIEVQPAEDPDCTWFSSVYGEEISNVREQLGHAYWVSNMANPVLLSQAVEKACVEKGPFDLAVEIGPHPALKGPVSQTVQEIMGKSIPYTGLLCRGKNAIETMSDAVGFLWTLTDFVDIEGYDKATSGVTKTPKLLKALPAYSWDHDRSYWHESRLSKGFRSRDKFPHELLGHQTLDVIENQLHWRNLLRPSEVTWIPDHQLQSQIVFPAAGYLVTAMEASRHIDGEREISSIEVQDFVIQQALVFNDEKAGVETLFSLTEIEHDDSDSVSSNFAYYSAVGRDAENLTLMARGRLKVSYGEPQFDFLPPRSPPQPNMIDVEEDRFYSSLAKLGYGYTGPFRALSSMKRKLGTATGLIANPPSEHPDQALMIHPSVLDALIQSVILAYCYPNDGRLWSLHLPTSIRRIKVNPSLCACKLKAAAFLPFDTALSHEEGAAVYGDVSMYAENGEHAMLQAEGIHAVPFSGATMANDTHIFSRMTWNLALPNGDAVADDGRATSRDYELASTLERMACFYLRELEKDFPVGHALRSGEPFHHYFRFMSHVNSLVRGGKHRYAKPEWAEDTLSVILSRTEKFSDCVDVKIMHVVGQQMPSVIRGQTTILEHFTQDNLLDDFYQNALGMKIYTRLLSRIVSQVTNRYPHMNVLEVGAGTGGATKSIFKETSNAFASYTFTDISNGFFVKGQEVFSDFENKMTFKVLDIEKDTATQGFASHFYDLVIASMVIHATHNLEQSLTNLRRLLKPGGYLIMMEMTNNDPTRSGFIFGTLPGWWMGSDEGRLLSPGVTSAQWDSLLRKTGFAGIDTITPDLDSFPFPLSVIVAQATDDRITLLRQPLTRSPEPLVRGNAFDSLSILGGKTLRTSRLAAEVTGYLRPHFRQISTITNIEDAPGRIHPGTTVMCLAELDEPVFRDMGATKFSGLKTLFQRRIMFWTTEGCRADCPYMNATVGFGRSQLCEVPDLRLQFVDLNRSEKLDARTMAEALLRLTLLESWTQQGRYDDILYSIEPELVLEREQLWIPRLKLDTAANDRYNSSRRPVLKDVQPQSTSVELTKSESLYILQESRSSSLHSNSEQNDLVTVQVSYSLLSSVRIASAGSWFVTIGTSVNNKDRVLALSQVHESRPVVPSGHLIESYIAEHQEQKFLPFIASNLVALSITADMSNRQTLLLHGPDSLTTAILMLRANEKGIRVFHTTTDMDLKDTSRIFIHPHSTKRTVKKLLPSDVSVFVNFSAGNSESSIAKCISACLPCSTRRESASTLFGNQMHKTGSGAWGSIRDLLQKAMDYSLRDVNTALVQTEQHTLSPEAISEPGRVNEPLTVIDWSTANSLSVVVKPVDSMPLFTKEKTYWLLGLTGGLGVSLCEWMIEHGASHIVLTSRHPNIDQNWLENMNSGSAMVKVFANDVTDWEDLQTVFEKIRSTMPPIAGVAHGAMVLRDISTREMTVEDMMKVLRPKMDGSIFLDKMFSDTSLDFLIFFSSMTGVTGNPGQANYSAANQFMASLAAQRRKRGLAASVINVGPIIGAGYVTREVTQAGQENLVKGGFMWMSERDFHQIFAEGVLASSPSSGREPDVSTGLRHVNAGDAFKPMWYHSPRFSHFVSQQVITNVSGGAKAGVSTKALLQGATSHEEVYDIIKDSFTSKLQTMLQMDVDNQERREDMINLRMDDLGIDSLIAVEIRSWFLKSLNINMPVLKILGGATIRDLLDHALVNLPTDLVPKLGANVSVEPTTVTVDTRSIHLAPAAVNADSSSAATSVVQESLQLSDKDSSISSLDGTEKHVISTPPEPAVQSREDLSYGQSMFWFVKMYLKDQSTLNHTGLFRLKGNLSIDELERAVHTVAQRHESLRTCFLTDDLQRPCQAILENPILHLERKMVVGDAEVVQHVEKIKNHIYDLGRGETMRILLLSQDSTTHFLIIGCHHINVDGISQQVLMSDLEEAYNQEPLSADVLQYPDFARRQREEYKAGKWKNELSFWRKEFGDIPEPLPILSLSEATSRRTLTDYAVHRKDLRLDPVLSSRIRDISRRHKATPFHFYLAALKTLLLRYTEVSDICIGIGDGNRIDDDMLSSIGPYVNLLPLRLRSKGTETFGAALQEARSKTFLALANSRIPFELLLTELSVPRSSAHTPLFQAFIDYRQGAQEMQSFGGCQLELTEFEAGRTGYDISLDIMESPESGSLIMLMVQKDLYSSEDAEILMNSYIDLLEAFSNNAQLSLDEAPIYRPADIKRAFQVGQGPLRSSEWLGTLCHRVDQMVQHHGERVAVKDSYGQVLTYRQFSERVDRIAAALSAANVRPSSKVAVFQEPTSDWISSLVAILRIGAVYVPLDLATPTARLSVIVNDCKPSAIVLDAATLPNLPTLRFQQAKVINVTTLSSSATNVSNLATLDAAAVVFYTSGSTGVPKGIVLKHSNLVNEIEWSSKVYGFGVENVLQQSAFSFDMSLTQIFSAIAYGGTLFMVQREARGDAGAITKMIASEKVSFTGATPSEYLNWLRYGDLDALRTSDWRVAITGGEKISEHFIHELRTMANPGLHVFNAYGPTEVTCSSNKMELRYNDDISYGRIAAGFPSPNVSVYIVDDHLRPLPIGVPGEILVGGAGVSLGYLNNDDLTNQKFIPDTFASEDRISQGWAMMHKTGDRGRWRNDGAILIEGRIAGDTQIKLRGLRIDLRDVETAIIEAANRSVVEAVVSVRQIHASGPQILVAHVVFSTDCPLMQREHLTKKLPHSLPLPQYMCPAIIIPLPKLPVNSASKLDRLAISSLPLSQSTKKPTERSSLTQVESKLRQVWEEVLSEDLACLHEIDADADFFHVGGNSVLLVHLQALIRTTFGVRLPLVRMFESSTLGHMASRVQHLAESSGALIDWQEETILSADLVQIPRPPEFNRDAAPLKTVILTGSTGFLGKELLNQLAADKGVKKIHCIAVRQSVVSDSSFESSKVEIHRGDLTLPRLGLSEDDAVRLFAEADAVVHNAAEVSHLKSFFTLRQANVGSTKELVRLSLPRRIPFHYVSTAGVDLFSGREVFEETTAAPYLPPLDGSDGYTASKWASERYLENANGQLHLPVWIHRPSNIAREDVPELDLLQNLLRYSRLMNAVPLCRNLRGALDIVSVSHVAKDILHELGSHPSGAAASVHYLHLSGDLQIPLDELKAFLDKESDGDCAVLSMAEWAQRAKSMGLNAVVAAFFENVETTAEVIQFPRLVRNRLGETA